MKKPTLKEQRFVDAFLGSCHGNATEAALSAGYTTNRKSAAEIGSRLLRNVKIAKLVKARQDKEARTAILTADERDAILSEIAEASQPKDRIAAIKELNKCGGRHSIRHVIDGKLTLEQVLTESRK